MGCVRKVAPGIEFEQLPPGHLEWRGKLEFVQAGEEDHLRLWIQATDCATITPISEVNVYAIKLIPAPEPSTATALLIGALALAGLRRWRRRKR